MRRASNCSLLPSANTQMSTHSCGASIDTARSHAVSYALHTSASMLMHSAVVYCGRSIILALISYRTLPFLQLPHHIPLLALHKARRPQCRQRIETAPRYIAFSYTAMTSSVYFDRWPSEVTNRNGSDIACATSSRSNGSR